jgi:hypothetical protein
LYFLRLWPPDQRPASMSVDAFLGIWPQAQRPASMSGDMHCDLLYLQGSDLQIRGQPQCQWKFPLILTSCISRDLTSVSETSLYISGYASWPLVFAGIWPPDQRPASTCLWSRPSISSDETSTSLKALLGLRVFFCKHLRNKYGQFHLYRSCSDTVQIFWLITILSFCSDSTF